MGDIMLNKFLIIMTFSALSLFGCGGGGTTTPSSGTSNTPTDTSLVFSLFAPEYLGGSYSVPAFPLTGSDTNGDSYTATQSVQSGDPAEEIIVTVDYVAPVKVIDVDTLITNTNTNAVITIADNKYYTHEPAFTDIRYFGYTNSLGILATPTSEPSINIIPLTATIGNFGTVGHYTREDGSGFAQDWELADGFNGKAILIVTTVPDDITTDTYPTTVEKFLISQDGTVSGFELIMTYHASNNTITLTN